MCARATRSSIPGSVVAVCSAAASLIMSLAILLFALLTAPLRLVRRLTAHVRPATRGAHIEVQVLLDDPRGTVDLRRAIDRGLLAAARVWAPLALPVHRVVVGRGPAFPAAGRADAYQGFPGSGASDLVVITLGVRRDQRDLEPAEIVGALVAQIQAVIAERYPTRALGISAPRSAGDQARANSPTPGSSVSDPARPDTSGVTASIFRTTTARSTRRQTPDASPASPPVARPLEPASGEEPTTFVDGPRLTLTANGQTH
jgi:hypothetical protein